MGHVEQFESWAKYDDMDCSEYADSYYTSAAGDVDEAWDDYKWYLADKKKSQIEEMYASKIDSK